MINKIDNSSPVRPSASVQSSGVVRRIASGSAEPQAAASQASASPRASSGTGKSLLERAGERAKASPDADMARVNEVKAAITRGEFSIDAKAVARAFINMESA